MKPKHSDRDVNAALLAYWRARDSEGDVKPGYGSSVARVRRLLHRGLDILQQVTAAVDAADAPRLDRALARFNKLDRKYSGTTLGDVIEDAHDVLEALQDYLPEKKRGKIRR